MHAGDVVNVGVLALTAAYAVLTLGHGKMWDLTWFGEHWARDGFCISFKDTPLQTHLLCFYGDTVLALLLLLCNSERSELRGVKEGAVPHFFHGVVHLGLWVVGDGFFASGGRQRHPLLGLGALVITFLFLRSYLNSDVQAIVHAVVLVFFVPELLLFSYVNTIIFLQATTMGLKYGHGGRKDKFYTLSSLMITLPIMLAAWAEPLLCDKGLVRYGGHILFDYSIPLSSLAFFAVAHTMEPRKKIAAMAEGDDDLAKKQKAT